jgi:hypothetical protein
MNMKIEKQPEEQQQRQQPVGGESSQARRERADKDELRGRRLSDRDRQLLRHLSTVRYLSTDQIRQLVFFARAKQQVSLRLNALSGRGPHPFAPSLVKRLAFPIPDRGFVPVWTLTPAGFAQVQRHASGAIRVPTHPDVSPQFLEHTIALNELYVGLVTAPHAKKTNATLAALGNKATAAERRRHLSSIYTPGRGLPFRWIGEDAGALPWNEYDLKAGERRDRLIEPDATLELPAAGQRWFVECEMGTQPIVSSRTDRQGATMAKVERYEKFLSSMADPHAGLTFYGKAFADGWPVTVLFLVQNPSREASVNEAIAEWRAKRGGETRVRAVALTLAKALAQLTPLIGAPAPAKPLVLSPKEFASLRKFYDAAANRVKAARDAARAVGQVPPEYPDGTHEVQAMIARLLQQG